MAALSVGVGLFGTLVGSGLTRGLFDFQKLFIIARAEQSIRTQKAHV